MTGRTDGGRVPNFKASTAASKAGAGGTNEVARDTSSTIAAGSGGIVAALRMLPFSA
jgi:hypothetical protein